MNFSERLYSLRSEKGISQKKLARMIGVSQSAIYYWEKGERSPKLEQLPRIATALNVSITDLVDSKTLDLADDVIALFSETKIQSEELYPFNPDENYIIIKYRELNEKGQQKAIGYIEDLTQIPEYQQDRTEGQ